MTASLDLATINARPKPCVRCRCIFRVVYPSSRTERERILRARQSVGIAAAIRVIHETTRDHLANAKGTAMHVAPRAGECHWCKKPIPEAEFVECPHCGSLNIQPNVI